jgi:hypothetical protein
VSVSILEPGASVGVPPGALQVRWEASGPGGGLEVVVRTDDGESVPGVQSLGPDRLLVLSLSGAVQLLARPVTGDGTLPAGTRLSLDLTVLVNGSPGAHVVLPPRDVSGTRDEVLVTVAPVTATRWRVSVPGGAGPERLPGLPRDEPAPLPDSPVALAAVYSARRACSSVRLPADRRRRLVVAVDDSASMTAHVRSGALQSLLEVVLGINAVVGAEPAIPVWRVGHRPERLDPDLGNDTAAEYVATTLADRPVTASSAVVPLLETLAAAGRAEDRRSHVVLLTDGPPADTGRLADVLPEGPPSLHLLAFGRTSGSGRFDVPAWQDEFVALRPLQEQRRVALAALPPEPDLAATRLRDEALLDLLVARLQVTEPPRDHLPAAAPEDPL